MFYGKTFYRFGKASLALFIAFSLFISILFAVALPTTAAASGNNLLSDASFENDPTGWNFWHADFTVTDELARTGSKSVKFTRSVENTWGNVNQYVTVTPNTEYIFEIYAKGNATFELSARKTDDWSSLAPGYYTGPSADEWTKHTYSFNSGDNTQVIIYIGEITNGTTYFDDASLAPVAPNLLSDASFENDPTGWNFWHADFTVTDELARTGSKSVKFTRSVENTWGNVNQYVTVTPNTEYIFEIYAKGNATFELSARKTDDWSSLAAGYYSAPSPDEWTKHTYSFNSGANSQVIIYIGEITNGTSYFDDASLVQASAVERGKLPDGPRLKDVAGSTIIGTRVNDGGTNTDLGKEIVLREFNSLQPTWYLNWGGWDAPDVMNTQSFNSWVNLGAENGMRHTTMHMFIGPDQYSPSWLINGTWTNAELETMLFNMVKNVIEQNGNKDKVQVWNLVNEALDYDNTGRYFGDGDQLFNQLGWEADRSGLTGDSKINAQHPLYIRKIFEYARTIAPQATLELRETGIDFTPDNNKGKAFYQLVKHLLNTGVPVDAVGLQGHVGNMAATPNWAGLKENIKRYKELGLEVYLTEVDIGDKSTWSEAKGNRQKELYQRLVTAAREAGVEGIYVWGVNDSEDNWRRGEDPLLLDKNYNPKPAYYGVQNALINTGMFSVKAKGTKGGEKIQLKLDGEVAAEWYLSKTYTDYCFMGHTNGAKNVKIEFVNAQAGGSVQLESLSVSGTAYDPRNYPTTANTAPSSAMVQNGYIDFGSIAAVTYDPARQLPPEVVVETKSSQIRYGTVTVDGTVDAVWDNAPAFRTDRRTGAVTDGTAAEADVKALWDENYLYVLYQVHDKLVTVASPNVWEQDSIEVFFDETNAKSGGFHPRSVQIRVNAEGRITSNPSDNMPQGFLSAVTRTDYGYLVECAIPWYDKSVAVNNHEIGFDAQVNDDMDGDGDRDGVAVWNDITGTGWQGPSVYGVMTLVDAPTIIRVNAELTGTTAKAVIAADRIQAAIDAAQPDANGKRNVSIVVKPIEGAKAYQVMMPTDIMVKKDGNVNILVETPSASVLMPNDMFWNHTLKNSQNIGIRIEQKDSTGFDSRARKLVGDRPVVDINAIADDKILQWKIFKEPIQVTLNYTLRTGEDPNKLAVYYVVGKCSLIMVKPTSYDSANGKITFTTRILGKFAIGLR